MADLETNFLAQYLGMVPKKRKLPTDAEVYGATPASSGLVGEPSAEPLMAGLAGAHVPLTPQDVAAKEARALSAAVAQARAGYQDLAKQRALVGGLSGLGQALQNVHRSATRQPTRMVGDDVTGFQAQMLDAGDRAAQRRTAEFMRGLQRDPKSSMNMRLQQALRGAGVPEQVAGGLTVASPSLPMIMQQLQAGQKQAFEIAKERRANKEFDRRETVKTEERIRQRREIQGMKKEIAALMGGNTRVLRKMGVLDYVAQHGGPKNADELLATVVSGQVQDKMALWEAENPSASPEQRKAAVTLFNGEVMNRLGRLSPKQLSDLAYRQAIDEQKAVTDAAREARVGKAKTEAAIRDYHKTAQIGPYLPKLGSRPVSKTQLSKLQDSVQGVREAQRQMRDLQAVSQQLRTGDNVLARLAGLSRGELGNQAAAIHGSLIQTMKKVYELGVLQKADIELLEKELPPPGSDQFVLDGAAFYEAKIRELSKLLKGRLDFYGFGRPQFEVLEDTVMNGHPVKKGFRFPAHPDDVESLKEFPVKRVR